jgi:hypothetical protein
MIRITAPHFVAGVDLVTQRSAPIVSFMRTWTWPRIMRYCQSKGWKAERV